MAAIVFVSYARKDQTPTDWVDRLKDYLAQFRQANAVCEWSDREIGPGSDWRREISDAIGRCNAAVLLVGPRFLASEFINTYELPQILEAARERGLQIFPLVALHCAYMESGLAQLQTFNDPRKPLEDLPRNEQNRILNQLGTDIAYMAGQLAAERAGVPQLVAVLKEILSQVKVNHHEYSKQNAQTLGLRDTIRNRLGITEEPDFEPFFLQYYDEMDRPEQATFQQIRAVTEGPIYEGNRLVLKTLLEHPELLNTVPELVKLQQHLLCWMSKYERTFRGSSKMCVCYMVESDAVPWPRDIEGKIEGWLATH
jgi:hypothetical protein